MIWNHQPILAQKLLTSNKNDEESSNESLIVSSVKHERKLFLCYLWNKFQKPLCLPDKEETLISWIWNKDHGDSHTKREEDSNHH